jgi:septal ring factor EnvC (AmiA/AmiB activator)
MVPPVRFGFAVSSIAATPVVRDAGRRLAATAICLLSLAATCPAQTASPAATTTDTLQQREKDLESVRDEQRKTNETRTTLTHEIEAISAERRQLNGDLIATAERLRTLERQIAESETRLTQLDQNERDIRRSLTDRRAVLAVVLAALQRIGRRPPPALMTAPEDALQAVRTAILLGAVLPEMRQEAEALAEDLSQLASLRQDIAKQREKLAADVAAMPQERERLARLIEQRQAKQAEREQALEVERQRAVNLARRASDLEDLITKLGKELAGSPANGETPTSQQSALSAFRDPGRLTPAIAFATTRGKLPLPVNGVKLRGYGTPDHSGNTEKGLSIATRAGAQVTAPADGWVVYAGPFRTYGQLLILNAGGGYHILLAGMDRISVDLGQFVLAGEPVATMGTGSRNAAITAAGSSQPVLYVEFRKNGVPVDPGPWWAASDGEKVRG